MPDETPNSPTEETGLTSTQAAGIAYALNSGEYSDAYSNAWTQTSVLAGHSNADPNQRKRLIYLLFLYAEAVG